MTDNEKIPSKPCSCRDHLANERTFLAWVRTALGIIVFGVAVERFALKSSQQAAPFMNPSQIAGFALVTMGILITVFAFIRFKTIEKELDQGIYKTHLLLSTALTFLIIALGIFLMFIEFA